MKKTMIIGKFNEVTKQISEKVAQFSQVQLCADDRTVAEGMLKLVLPDLIIVSLVGAGSAQEDLFDMLLRATLKTEFLVIGTRQNEEDLADAGYLAQKRLHFLCRPVKLETVTDRAKELLRLDEEPARKTVLVVDDSPATIRTMQSMLGKTYNVIFATSGPRAMMTISKTKPDLILLDYDMPVCDGKLTLQMLRSEDETKDIPVIFLTGVSDPTLVGELLALRPQGYLLKPPSEEKVRTTLEKFLGPAEAAK